MIHADLDKILPEADALEKITSIIEEVETNQELFIITKSGRPAVAIINIDYLEELTGSQVSTQKSRLFENPQDDEPILQEEEVPAIVTQSAESTDSPQPPIEPAAQTPPSPIQTPPPATQSAPTSETPLQPTSTTTINQSDDNLPPENSNSGSPMG